MLLNPGGMDVFYIDESHDSKLYAATAVAVPFMRQVSGQWTIVWPNHLAAAKAWRRRISTELKIPAAKELHGTKLMSGRGLYIYGKRQLAMNAAATAYRRLLSWIDFLPEASVITVVGQRGHQMYGHERLQRVMYALFQRMRRQCVGRKVNAMVFFDEGHPEYRHLYRRALKHLPTGSQQGGWDEGGSRNLPLDMFVKDANEKRSAHCLFTQAADLIAFAAFSKVRHERGMLEPDQVSRELHTLYDDFPRTLLNLRSSLSHPRDGIVRLR